MESFFVRFRNALVLVAVLLTQTILLAVQVRDPKGPSQADGRKVLLIRSWVVAAATPFGRLTVFLGGSIRRGWANYVDLRHTRDQNAALQREVARLRLEQAEFAEDAMQGRRLQSLLAFRQQYVRSTVAAQVIGTSGVDRSRVLYIDKGAADGLKPDMAVITPDGIVGKLRDVFQHTAQVLEIDDPSSGAGVILASTRIRAIIRGGADGRVQIGNLTADSRIKPGEVVLTSGGDQVFPRGLKVGTIESIAQDRDRQIYTLIQVRPAVNLSQLEEVLVITGTQSDLPLQAQEDLANGEAVAVEAKRAAQLAAERLPSLNPVSEDGTTALNPDGTPKAEQSDTGATPPVGVRIPVPKPLPTMHPDRYTPGVTAPAASLTPGGNNSIPAVPSSSGDAGSSSPATEANGTTTSKATKPKKQPSPSDSDPITDAVQKQKPGQPAPKEPQR